jgi:2-keto-myo-inositol isomerase
MRAEQLAINSQCTSHRKLEEALKAHAAAGFRNAEPRLNLVRDWLDDGHTVEQTRDLFESYGLRVVASSQLEISASARRTPGCRTCGPTRRTRGSSTSWAATS